MTRIVHTLAPALAIAVLLLCGSPSHVLAQGSTKIVIKDGGSLLLHADGLDGGTTWSVNPNEIRHANTNGVLGGIDIVDGTTDRCAGSPTCGVNPTRPWSVQVTYGSGSVTIASLTTNKGVHLKHSKLRFDLWQHTSNADEREFGHGDGLRISSITVNGGQNLCSGHGCQITLSYSPR